VRLTKEVDRLKKMLLALSAAVEDSVRKSVVCVEESDAKLAAQVVEADNDIDTAEVELEEECLKVLALHQPVAIDLRYIIAILKINNDIERIGDLAVNIAQRAQDLESRPGREVPSTIPEMAEKVRAMLRNSLDALVGFDSARAKEVLTLDDEVDALHRSMYARLDRLIKEGGTKAALFVPYLSISRNLERIADSATNIAEDVIYLVDGAIVRHRRPARK
jgi:phosphate transport system protein